MPALIQHVLQQCGFVESDWMCETGQQIGLLLKMYDQSWKGESDNDDHRMLSFWSRVSSETGQKWCLQNFNN